MISEQELVLFAGAGTFSKDENIYQKGKVQLQTQSANEVTGEAEYDEVAAFTVCPLLVA